jgi:hypothetical protein
LTPGAQPGWGSNRGWSDAVTGADWSQGARRDFGGAGPNASAGAVRCEAVQASELLFGRGPGAERPGASPSTYKKTFSSFLRNKKTFLLKTVRANMVSPAS